MSKKPRKRCAGIRTTGYFLGSQCGSWAEPDDDFCGAHKGMTDREERFEKARKTRQRREAREAKQAARGGK